jgi:bifunctional non-homologous end joining protein LigD
MIPTPVLKPFHRDGWAYEEKVDGYRMIAYKDGRDVRLISRTGTDYANRYSDLANAIAQLEAPTLVLDGELAVFDARLRSHGSTGCATGGRLSWRRRLCWSPSMCSMQGAAI